MSDVSYDSLSTQEIGYRESMKRWGRRYVVDKKEAIAHRGTALRNGVPPSLSDASPLPRLVMPVCRFPYMSCEIICCEVPHILNAVASESNPAPLAKLFSMLDEEGDLDNHRAGYLEKVTGVV